VPTSQIVADAVDPLAQALANLLQFGRTPALRTGTTGFQLPGQTLVGDVSALTASNTLFGLPLSTILFLGVGILAFSTLSSGRRR
jgi:hypothetical protein